MDIAALLYTASTWVVPVLLAITLHEAAHAYAAYKLGDDTAARLGRVSFNPIKHIDAFGTILLPALLLFLRAPFLFGWAKPVPVMFGRLGNPRRDMVLVAAAGPAINIVLAAVSALLFRFLWLLPGDVQAWSSQMLTNSVILNLVLAVFNMLPLPPLDGGRIAVGLLPDVLAARALRHVHPARHHFHPADDRKPDRCRPGRILLGRVDAGIVAAALLQGIGGWPGHFEQFQQIQGPAALFVITRP